MYGCLIKSMHLKKMFLSINYLLFIIVNETGTDVIKLHYWKKKKKNL